MSGLIGAGQIGRIEVLLSEAQTVEERRSALRLLSLSEAMGRDLSAGLETVSTFEAVAPPRMVATLLVEVVRDDLAFSNGPEPGRLSALERAIAIGDSVDSVFADSIRLQAVGAIVGFEPSAGVVIATGIRDPAARQRAMSSIVHGEIERNVSGPLDTASSMIGPPLMDSIYAMIAERQAVGGLGREAVATARRITSRALWAVAISDIAAASRVHDENLVSAAELRAALSQLDPQVDYATLETRTLPVLIASGDRQAVVSWARGKSGSAGAYARLAAMSALLQCGSARGGC